MDILLAQPSPVPVHALAALAAIILGAVQLAMPKGTNMHRVIGRLWVGLMAIVALSSFCIFEIRVWGLFSPIHLLSLFTLAALVEAVRSARIGKIARHKTAMQALYVLALLLTGLLTLWPGRVMHQIVFG